MTPERWQRVEELFAAAKELSSADLDSYLRRECGEDRELEREVASLLEYHHSNVGLLNEHHQPWQGLLRDAAEPPTFIAGATFGPYLIRNFIGSGGMGDVYLAEDTRLHRMVALKVLPSWLSREAWRVARFTHEALAASALNHPNVPVVYEAGEIDQRHYIASEYVDGSPLSSRISQGVVPWREAIGLTLQAASALQAAHAAGIVHRDVKPGNILVGRADGRLKLVDFGIAKLAEDFELRTEERATLTAAGAVVGTPGYMAPEQAAGIQADSRSDIWSLAAVLHEMVTGRTPTPGSSKIRASSNLPAALARVLERALQPDPDKRYPVMAEFAAGLDRVLRGIRLGTHASLAWSVAAVAAAGIAGAAWGILHHPPIQPRTVVRWTWTEAAGVASPALSRDGTRLAMSEFVSEWPHLSLRMMDQAEGKPIPGSKRMFCPEFSPDGQWIAAFYWGPSGTKLKKIPVAGGTAITLADVTKPVGITWGDDDTIVFSDGKGLFRVSSAGGAVQSISTPDKKKGEARHSTPHFLPGAGALLFTIGGASSSQVALLDLKTGRYRVLVNNGVDGRYVPSGHLVYARGDTLFAAPFDIKRLAVTGPEAPAIHDLSLYGPYLAMAEYAFSDSGLLVYMDEEPTDHGGGSFLAWIDRQGQVQLLSGLEEWGIGRLSPDGRRVANEIYGTLDGNYEGPGDIWIFELERRTKTRLTFEGANLCPIWTPDGRRITFGGNSAGKHGIYSVKADGSEKPELLVATDSAAEPTSWSPDGKYLLYQQVVSGFLKIWLLPVSGGVAGKPVPLHDNTVYEGGAQVSPDGRWVAYVSNETGQKEVYIQPFPGPGGKEPVSTQGGYTVRWSRNGRELFYRSEAGLMAMDIQTSPRLRIGLPKVISKLGLGYTWDTAPDGQHFLVEALTESGLAGRLQGVSDWFEELRRRVPVTR
jgi:Tol biopolymer transport system component